MPKYKITVDRDVCVGDNVCCENAPGTFKLDDDQKVVVTNPEGDPPENILAAARNCPLDAIILHDAHTGAQVWPDY